MSTNASIAVKTKGGKYEQIYLHWDGYPEHTGKRLVENFNTQELAEELVGLGDLSCIGTRIGHQHPFEAHGSESYRDMCCAYGRDRGERDTKAQVFDTFEDMARGGNDQQYNYVFIDGTWYLSAGSIVKDRLLRLESEEVNV